MILDTTNNWRSPVRNIKSRVELYNGSALVTTYSALDNLKSFNIERVGEESKFFGFGVCQKLNTHLIDNERAIDITTANSFKAYLSTGGDLVTAAPTFYVTESHRDENTNELSITAYDALYKAAEHYVEEIKEDLQDLIDDIGSYDLIEFSGVVAHFLGLNGVVFPEDIEAFYLSFSGDGANLEGTETIREVLNAIAEATQTIYYIDKDNYLVFRQLAAADAAADLTITKDDYITLKSGDNRRLATIVNATELGDNVSSSTTAIGSTQYVRDNPFWELRDDINILVEEAIARIGGLTINQFECSWRGNFAVEIGDKIALITKDNNTAYSFVLNDVITYDGGLSQTTSWSYTEDAETASNPATLGEALKKTYARVDKVNKQVDIVVNDTTSLKLTVSDITTTVKSTNDKVDDLATQVTTKTSAEDVTIIVDKEIANGVNKVTTSTGYTFNSDGLKITKDDSDLSTEITENGMQIFNKSKDVLTVNNEGVKAEDLHATTYLIIGKNNRFEDYQSSRTGCFWIG